MKETLKGSERVLVVDDNVALAENIAEILAFEGYDTEVAANGEQALAMALADDLTFIVTDYRLPGIDGVDLIDRVLSAGRAVRAIVISGHTDEKTMSRAREIGAAFFAKPVNVEALKHYMRAGENDALS